MKSPVIGDVTYGSTEVSALREEIIVLRDGALKNGEFGWSVKITHVIGLLAVLAEELATPPESDAAEPQPEVARLYYEAHITVEPKGDFAAFAEEIARCPTWKASRFDEDHVDEAHGMWFLSARCKHISRIRRMVGAMLDVLREDGFTVVRWKIEDTVLDSNEGSEEEELER